MSEFGCITNNRTFQEIASLYSTDMTGVFSGGLVYEYSQEANGYGLVTIAGDTVVPNSDFTALESAYSAQANPTGNGGASSTSAATTCPTESSEWDVSGDSLPSIPSAAEKYLTSGAGTGPGLSGSGSQEAGDAETEGSGTGSAGSGSAVATGSSSTKSASAGVVTISAVDVRAFGMVLAVMLGMLGGMAIL